jgi:hypothetical protein
MTPDEFATHVVKQSRGTWLNGTFDVEGVGPIGIKAFNNYIQRMQWSGLVDGGDFNTQRAMKNWILSRLEAKR